MKEKIDVKINNNFLFYLFLKKLNSTHGLSTKEIDNLLEKHHLYNTNYTNMLSIFNEEIEKIKSTTKRDNIKILLLKITSQFIFDLFILSLKLLKIKPLLLEEAKIYNNKLLNNNKNINALSLEYDSIGKHSAYYTRVNGALIALMFFSRLEKGETSFLSDKSSSYIKNLLSLYTIATNNQVEPNQIFMLMFAESVSQSIKSNAGSSYESNIKNVLISIGIASELITKTHSNSDKSTEYDFFFILNNNKTYGISAKRTLRERYKQFIKTNQTHGVDIMIEITLGLDLTIEKAKTIRQHNTYLFIADEVYESQEFLRNMNGVYPASKLNLTTLLLLT